MRRLKTSWRGAVALAIVLAAQQDALADYYDIIICGSGGEAQYEKQFTEWGTRLRTILVEQFNRDPAHTYLFLEHPEGEKSYAYDCTRESIRTILADTSQKVTEQDTVFVYLIGHGSYLRRVATLNIPGPDIRAEDFAEIFDGTRTRRIILINSASASAGFINALSAPGWVICSATKSVSEVNATEFMESFLQSLEDGSADQNRDERISILEVCQQAAALTETWYMSEGLLATEHALLDDNGDGLGTRLPILEIGEVFADREEEGDGLIASQSYIKDFMFPENVPHDLVQAYLGFLAEVEDLRGKKDSMDLEEYYVKLESLLVEAATVHREIRRIGGTLDKEETSGREDILDDLLLIPGRLK